MPRPSFRLTTALTAAIGCLALLLTGEANPVLSLPVLLIPVGYYRQWRGRSGVSRRIIGVFVFLDLAIFAADLIAISRDTLLAVVHLTLFFQALKSFDMNSHEDDTQVLLMGLLQIILVSELTLSAWFAVLLLMFMVNLVISLMDGYLNRDVEGRGTPLGREALRVSTWTLAALLVIFFAIPRSSWLGFFGKSHLKRIQTTGFSEAVDFGSYGEVKRDDTVVMRAELEGPIPASLYWRGNTLDTFNGLTWNRSAEFPRSSFSRDRRFRLAQSRSETLLRQTIYLEPVNTRILFAIPEAVEIEGDFMELLSDDERVYQLRREPRGRLRYIVWSDPDLADDSKPPGKATRELPEGFDRIRRLAGELTDRIPGENARASLIQSYLRNRFTYSLETAPPPPGVHPVEDFLFNTRKGYCEHFATAMALMLRGVGIPSRIVTGFMGGEMNPVGSYVLVRQSDAHSWVEAWIGGRWQRFDPTPPGFPTLRSRTAVYLDAVRMAWYKYVVSYSSLDQRHAIGAVGSGLRAFASLRLSEPAAYLPKIERRAVVTATIAALAGLFLWLVLKRRPGRGQPRESRVTAAYRDLLKTLEQEGYPRQPTETPREFARKVAASGGPPEIQEATEVYYRGRYGKEDVEEDIRRIASRIRRSEDGRRKTGG